MNAPSRERDIVVSIIFPTYNEAEHLLDRIHQIWSTVENRYDQFEIVIVDDGSTDRTSQVVQAAIQKTPGIRYLRLTRHFGLEVSLTAGLDAAIGDYIVIIQPASDPTELIPEFIEQCKRADVCIGVRKNAGRDSLLVRTASHLFYRACEALFEFSLPRHTTYFIAFTRKAVTQITRTKDRFRFIKAITASIGLRVAFIPYETGRRRSFWDSLNLSIDVITSNSLRPLRLASLACGSFALGCGAYLGYVLAIFLFKNKVAEGWTTLSGLIAGGFMVLLFALMVCAEYLRYLLAESRSRPLYYVMEDKSSNQSVTRASMLNVLETST